MRPIGLALAIVFPALAACSPLVGTWRGEQAASASPIVFGTVTFAPDGSYSASATYTEPGGQPVLRTMSGLWHEFEYDQVLVGRRKYRYAIAGETVIFTDPVSDRSIILTRVTP